MDVRAAKTCFWSASLIAGMCIGGAVAGLDVSPADFALAVAIILLSVGFGQLC